ncbi:hypothetical protein [Actinoplanes solisilvae]|nr:hypothetical protein [Actinoplanes solisilvae]
MTIAVYLLLLMALPLALLAWRIARRGDGDHRPVMALAQAWL